MKIEIKNEGNAVCAYLDGRFDTVSATECEKDFMQLKEATAQEIIIDCTALNYISSSGLRLFLSLRKAIDEKNGKLIIRHINDDIRNVLTITGFFKLFDIRP